MNVEIRTTNLCHSNHHSQGERHRKELLHPKVTNVKWCPEVQQEHNGRAVDSVRESTESSDRTRKKKMRTETNDKAGKYTWDLHFSYGYLSTDICT